MLHKIKQYFLMTLTALILSQSAYAQEQAIDANDVAFANNQTVTVKLSIKNPNRIFVKGDKISDISYEQAYSQIKLQKNTGDAMIVLGSMARQLGSFTIYLTTVAGRQFTLVVIPSNSIGQTIQFVPQAGGSIKAKEFEKKSPYQETLAEILKYMMAYDVTSETPPGYAAVEMPSNSPVSKKGKLLVFPVRIFQGVKYAGLVYGVKNNSKTKIENLTAKKFYQKGTLAGALDDQVLEVGQVTHLYEIVAR